MWFYNFWVPGLPGEVAVRRLVLAGRELIDTAGEQIRMLGGDPQMMWSGQRILERRSRAAARRRRRVWAG